MRKTICTSPLIRAETVETYVNKKGGISYKTEFLDRSTWDSIQENGGFDRVKMFKGRYRNIQPIPCGQCINCMMNKAAENATKMMMMKPYYPEEECWFLTFTYKDEMLPVQETVNTETGETWTGTSLRKRDLQLFWKKIRKDNPNLKYVSAGEYGGQTGRPHYHAIVFGLQIPLDTLKKVGQNWLGQPYWQSDWLNSYWVDEEKQDRNGKPINRGNIEIGEVTWKSCSYVARYVIKKANKMNSEWFRMQGRIPEYITWSNGFGDKFFEEHKETIKATDTIYLPNGDMKTPRKFMELLKESDPELYEDIKKKRKESAKANQASLHTDKNREAYRQMLNEKKKSNFKDIRRI